MNIIQKLYNSEINVKITTFYDAGYEVIIGDDMNGIKANTCVNTWQDAEDWLIKTVTEIYPNSDFVKQLEGKNYEC